MVRHRFKCPRKSQYEYRRHHLLESCGDRIHTFVELQHTAEHIICDYNYQRRDRAERQTVSRIAVCKCRHKIRTGEKSAGIDHTHNAEHDKHSNRKYKVYNPATLGHRLCVLLISIVFCRENITVLCVILVYFHRSVIRIAHRYEYYHKYR